MSAGTSASFCLMLSLLLCSSEALEIITAEHGQDVTLPCKADNNNKPITAVKWNRSGLDPEYVLLYQDGRFDPDNQHPFYKNRADLKDREMKDGDVSLVLKNVTMEDEGTYKCRGFHGETGGMINDPINSIYLVVLPPVSSIDQENITAELGQDITLTCKAENNNKPIKIVKWVRPDLDPENVLMYWDGRLHPDEQHPSYVNRTDLKDREMKDGDVSLVLKNVTMEDEATYECWVGLGETSSWIFDIIKSRINLEVLPPGDKDGGAKDGGAKDGGDKDGGDKDGGDKDGRDKDGGDKDGEA